MCRKRDRPAREATNLHGGGRGPEHRQASPSNDRMKGFGHNRANQNSSMMFTKAGRPLTLPDMILDATFHDGGFIPSNAKLEEKLVKRLGNATVSKFKQFSRQAIRSTCLMASRLLQGTLKFDTCGDLTMMDGYWLAAHGLQPSSSAPDKVLLSTNCAALYGRKCLTQRSTDSSAVVASVPSSSETAGKALLKCCLRPELRKRGRSFWTTSGTGSSSAARAMPCNQSLRSRRMASLSSFLDSRSWETCPAASWDKRHSSAVGSVQLTPQGFRRDQTAKATVSGTFVKDHNLSSQPDPVFAQNPGSVSEQGAWLGMPGLGKCLNHAVEKVSLQLLKMRVCIKTPIKEEEPVYRCV